VYGVAPVHVKHVAVTVFDVIVHLAVTYVPADGDEHVEHPEFALLLGWYDDPVTHCVHGAPPEDPHEPAVQHVRLGQLAPAYE